MPGQFCTCPGYVYTCPGHVQQCLLLPYKHFCFFKIDYISGFSDRIFAISASNTGFTYCWASCTQCDGSAANIIESNITNVSVSPNPCENFTTFNFNLKNSNETNISIYDITGKLVDNVINSVITRGSQSVEYNTSNLNNGIYIYKINSDNEDITGKLIIK